jgi:hypothetical protein
MQASQLSQTTLFGGTLFSPRIHPQQIASSLLLFNPILLERLESGTRELARVHGFLLFLGAAPRRTRELTYAGLLAR